MKTAVALISALALLSIATLAGIAAYWAIVLPPRVAQSLESRADQAQRSLDAALGILEQTQTGMLRELRQARRMVDSRLAAIQADARHELARTNNTLASGVDRIAGSVERVAGIAPPAQELLTASAALAIEAKQSWQDLYWDMKAATESATVAARGVAEASEAVGKAAPAITASVATIAGEGARVAPKVATNVEGITTDAKKITGRLSSPWIVVKKAAIKIGRFLLKPF